MRLVGMMSYVWHNGIIPANNQEYIQAPYYWVFVREIHQSVGAPPKAPIVQILKNKIQKHFL